LVRLTNYTKAGESYDQQLSVEPLLDPSGICRCFQATSLILRHPGEPIGALGVGLFLSLSLPPSLFSLSSLPPSLSLSLSLSSLSLSFPPAAPGRADGCG